MIAALTKKQEELGNCISYKHAYGAGTGTVANFSSFENNNSSSTNSSTLPKDDAWGRPAGTSGPHTSGEGI